MAFENDVHNGQAIMYELVTASRVSYVCSQAGVRFHESLTADFFWVFFLIYIRQDSSGEEVHIAKGIDKMVRAILGNPDVVLEHHGSVIRTLDVVGSDKVGDCNAINGQCIGGMGGKARDVDDITPGIRARVSIEST